MAQTYKKISVVVPNYNYSHKLEKRVKTIINQTYPIHELIILDDASTDDSIAIIKKIEKDLKEKSINVKIIANKKNSGNVFKQWQKGFELTTGDYIWIAEADDLAENTFLENIMQGFNDEETVLSYSRTKMINEKGRMSLKRTISQRLLQTKNSHWRTSYINDGKKEIKEVLCVYNTIPNVSAVVFKKIKKIDYHKLLDEAQRFSVAGDWYFYCHLLLHGKIAYFKDPLNIQCIHEKSVTSTTKKELYLKEVEKMHETISNIVSLDEKSKKAMKVHEKYLKSRFHL